VEWSESREEEGGGEGGAVLFISSSSPFGFVFWFLLFFFYCDGERWRVKWKKGTRKTELRVLGLRMMAY